jgi:hypothetical protein
MSARFFFHLYSHKIFFWLFIATFIGQIFFWRATEKFHGDLEIIPPAPNKYIVSAASLGDNEFLFRSLSLRLQNSGDIFAGFVALKDYDYSRVYDWMKTLDTLNSESSTTPALAAYYYSQTQNKNDATKIIDYLDEHSSSNIDANWWWLFQSVYIAKRIGDFNRALELAQKLAQNNAADAPIWTKQMPAFISEEMGEGCLAFEVISKLISESESGARKFSADEMNFMRHFINERLHRLKEGKFDPRKCSKKL